MMENDKTKLIILVLIFFIKTRIHLMMVILKTRGKRIFTIYNVVSVMCRFVITILTRKVVLRICKIWRLTVYFPLIISFIIYLIIKPPKFILLLLLFYKHFNFR